MFDETTTPPPSPAAPATDKPDHIRSFLVIPAIRHAEYLPHLIGCVPRAAWPDAVIIDLEDSVPDERKAEARRMLADALPMLAAQLRTADGAAPKLLIKINAAQTDHYADDLNLLKALVPLGIGAALAKTERVQDIEDVLAITGKPPRVPVFPAIETVLAYETRDSLLGHAARCGVTYVAFGAGDMATDLGVERDYDIDVLRTVFVGLLLTCRRYGLRLADSPSRAIPKTLSDRPWEEVLRDECRWDARNGVAAKIAIHPEQIPILHEELGMAQKKAWARQVLADFARQPDRRSVVSSADGRYMGTPTLKLAKRILGLA